MKRSIGLGLALALFGFGCSRSEPPAHVTHALVSPNMVISQIYGGGGSPGASWHNDYVELYNRGTDPVDLNGWSVQYGAQSGNIVFQVSITTATVVQPNHYFLISLGSSGSHGANLAADLVGTGASAFNISNADGKVALVSNATALGCGTAPNRCTSTSIVDLVGYGEGTDYEGTAAVSPTGVNGAIFRAGGGCIDTDDNSVDFGGATAVPRKAASAAHVCDGIDDAGMPVDMEPDLVPPPDLASTDLASTDLASTDLAGVDLAKTDLVVTDLAGTPATKNPIVISQIYGAGGETGGSYRNDFVELFNRTDVDVDISSWSVQYASKDNSFSLEVVVPDGTIVPAGGYYLIRLSSGGNTGATVTEPDLTINTASMVNISASSGKLALVDRADLAGCGTTSKPCNSPDIVDLVGYGAASAFEGAPAATFAAASDSLFRKVDGCQDTDHNDADFLSAAAAPRNSGSPINLCSLVVMMDAAASLTDAAADDGAVAVDDAAVSVDGSVSKDAASASDGAVTSKPDLTTHAAPDLRTGVTTRRAEPGCGCDQGGGGQPVEGLLFVGLMAVWRMGRLRRSRST